MELQKTEDNTKATEAAQVPMMTDRMIESAAALGIKVRGVSQMHHDGQIYLTLSYDQIPAEQL